MSDITQGQDAAPEKPDVDTLFGAKDVDTLFPADYKPTDQPVRNVSPIQDMIFSNPGRSHARVLDAFGYGFKQDWGAGNAELSEADEALRKAGVYNDYAKGQRNIIKAANEAVMRPAVAALLAAKSAASGVFHGAQEAVAQVGTEAGAPSLGRELASIPEAFPAGLHQMAGIPHVPEIVTHAKSLDTIGSGEAGYFGTAPIEAEPAKAAAEAAKAQDVAKPEPLSGKDAEAAPSPVAPPAAPTTEPADIHTVARQIAPETFQEFDTLAEKKDTFRRWIAELREVRDQTAREDAPHGPEIADIEQKLQDATPRLAKKYQARLDPLVAERDAYIAEHTQADSPDMAKVRGQLMSTDYRMRDLSGDVAKAYRDAQERMPQGEAPEAAPPEAIAHEEKPVEAMPGQAPVAGEVAAEPVTALAPAEAKPAKPVATPSQPEALIKGVEKGAQFAGKQAIKPDTPEEAARLPIAHAPSIVADVSQKLVAAGRPAEEAQAAAQVVASYWETRAQRFEGKKGTAAEMYAAEAPEIKAGKEKPSKNAKARELELAQRGEYQQAAPNEPRTKAIPEAAGEMLSSYKDDKAIKAHPDYKAAKAGDPDAAARLVAATVDPATIEAAKQHFGTDAIYAPVVAEEATGHNAIPNLLAAYYADEVGGSVSTDIGQINKAFHTGAGPMERLGHPAHFEGPVVPGGKYILVDDVSVMGSTLASMADHIQRNGGEVAGVVTLANASRTGVLRASKAHVADIERRYGNEVRDLFQSEPSALTADEAAYIRNFRDADALRAAANASEGKRNARLRAKGVGEAEGGQDLNQTTKGRIRLRDDARATVTLMKTADASTFIHETGHEWLDRMLDDARDEEAPASLRADSDTVMKWLGVDSPDGIKTRHHEKFARGFETYMMEGRAPSQALARVFAQFKAWLTTIYRTVAALKAPISDDIRGVFDRLLTETPEKTVIAPERETKGGLAETHEELAATTPPERSHQVAATIEAERDSHADRTLVKAGDHDTRLTDTGAETEGRAPGSAQSASDANAPGPVSGGSPESGRTGALSAGGSEVAGEGAGVRKESAAEQLSPTADLPKSETHLIDKAGNIRLDNLGTGEDVNAVIRATAEELSPYDTAITRGRVSDAEVLKLADALGMDAGKLAERKLGEAFNAEQIVAARKLLIQSAGAVRDAAAKIAGGTEAEVVAYAEARARHLMIQEQVSGLTAEAGRALRAFRDLGGSKEAADISAFLRNTQGKTLYQMKEEGALLAMMETPQQVSKAVAEANQTVWQKTRSGILSWFINNLISGPITHAGYSVGNTVTQLLKATVTTSLSASIGALRDLPPAERVYFGEVGAQLYGMVRGMRDGFGPAMTAFKTGVPFMKGDVDALVGQIEAAYRPQAIPGKFGYVMETPSRAVTAIHTVHYGMNYEAEIARRAYRSAMVDGLEPGSDAFNTKIADFTQAPPEAEMRAAHDEALKMVLMKSAAFGTAQYHLQRAVNSNILAKLVMPFMQVGANILKEGFVEHTPLAFASETARNNLLGKNGAIARDTQIAKVTVGIGISTAVLGLTAEGTLTGGGPSDPKQLAIKEMTGWKPYSIRVGESYVPYRKYLGFMGPLIAGVSDMYEVGHALNDEGLTKAAASSLFGFAEVVADESWAKGLSNFIDAARHWDRDGGRYLRNLAADFIPFSVGLQQITTLTDPNRREVRNMLDVARRHIPGLSQGLFPVRDIWGEPIEAHTALGPSQVNNDPATKALLDAGYYPGRLERKIRGVELSDQQYDDFTRTGGRMAKMRMNALVNTPGFTSMPKQVQSEKIKDIITSARESARSIILMQNPDIITKANAAKTAKLRGEPAH